MDNAPRAQSALRPEAPSGDDGFFDRFLANSLDAIFVTIDDRVIRANPAAVALFGVAEDQLIGHSPSEFLDPEYITTVHERIEMLRTGVPTPPIRERFLTPNGIVDVLVSSTPLHIDGISITAIVMRALPPQITEALDAGRLNTTHMTMAIAAHEFRNILAAAEPFVELLARASAGSDRAATYATFLRSAITRGRYVANEILADIRQTDVTLVPLDFAAFVRNAVSEVKAALPSAVTLDFVGPHEPVWIMGDASALDRVIWNLATNARDAMPNGGRMTIEVHTCIHCGADCDLLLPDEVPGLVCLRVIDTGEGIAPDAIGRIFDPLFTTKKHGSGLGLAFVQHIITAHGGYVFATSRVGAGTTLTCVLAKMRPAE